MTKQIRNKRTLSKAVCLLILVCCCQETVSGQEETPAAESAGVASAVADVAFATFPAGEFWMGADAGEAAAEDAPRHRVRLSTAVEISQRKVTVGQFLKFVRETGYRTVAEQDGHGGLVWDTDSEAVVQRPNVQWRHPGRPQTLEDPVVQVAWRDAMMYCTWLGSKLGVDCRLPTEAEWEYVCRATAQKDELEMLAEPAVWCLDLYGPYPDSEVVDPQGPERGTHRVFRGASVLAPNAMCWTRFHKPVRYRADFLSFRVVRTPSPYQPSEFTMGRSAGSQWIRERNERGLENPADYYAPHLTTQRLFELRQWRNRPSPFHRYWKPPEDRFMPLEIRRRDLSPTRP